MARPKKQLVEKVAEETKVPAIDLERLPVESLEKLDVLVEDKPVVEGKKQIGVHPITKEPVYL